MNIFGREPASDDSRLARAAKQQQDPMPSSHRVTLDLYRAEVLAAMLAKSRASNVLEVPDLLAGMYISNWDRLSRYWAENKRDEIEMLLRGICRISPQRWHSWIESYENARSDDGKPLWRKLRRSKRTKPGDTSPRPSADMASILKNAEELTPFREKSRGSSTPILTTECVLLCILRNFGSEISRKLAASGIDEQKLERDVLLPRRSPLT